MVYFPTANRHVQRLIIGSAISVIIGGVAQAQDDAVANYAQLLDKRHALTVKVKKLELEVQTQEAKIASLRAEIEAVPGIKGAVPDLVKRMVDSYAAEYSIDPPFNAAERNERLVKLQDQLKDGSSTPASMLRRAIGMYEAEVNYGMTVEQYPGNHPLEARAGWRLSACQESLLNEGCNVTSDMREKIRDKTGKEFGELDAFNERDAADMKAMVKQFDEERKLFDGNYLRVGRLALIYADVDGGEVLQFDVKGKRDAIAAGESDPQEGWIPVEGADQIALFRAVKMAKGEAAVDVMKIPVVVAE